MTWRLAGQLFAYPQMSVLLVELAELRALNLEELKALVFALESQAKPEQARDWLALYVQRRPGERDGWLQWAQINRNMQHLQAETEVWAAMARRHKLSEQERIEWAGVHWMIFQAQQGWDFRRSLTKINYRLHTDAIKENLIPPELTPQQTCLIYAAEADVLNMALFGSTAKEWRSANPDKQGNVRDYANVSQLVCLANLENLNSVFIQDGLAQQHRLTKLNQIAISQMKILCSYQTLGKIDKGPKI